MENPVKNPFPLPPQPRNSGGEWRRVGFELEFSGITMQQAIGALQSSLGARVATQSVGEALMKQESLGDFNVELDWAYLKKKAAERGEDKPDSEWLELLGQAASLLVPVEVVCPPVPMNKLNMLVPMVTALREAGAMGTEESLLAAYGVHINTEIPSLDADTLFDYLRAFALLQWWLVDAHKIDPTRRLTPYVDLYPEAYLIRILSRKKASMDQIFDDYFEFNATRNRALDLLPLLAEVDERRVQLAVKDPRVNARPAFHYRLPDCHIEKSDWALGESWQTWLAVENLANRPDALDELSTAFCAAQRPLIGVSRKDWVQQVSQWLENHASA